MLTKEFDKLFEDSLAENKFSSSGGFIEKFSEAEIKMLLLQSSVPVYIDMLLKTPIIVIKQHIEEITKYKEGVLNYKVVLKPIYEPRYQELEYYMYFQFNTVVSDTDIIENAYVILRTQFTVVAPTDKRKTGRITTIVVNSNLPTIDRIITSFPYWYLKENVNK